MEKRISRAFRKKVYLLGKDKDNYLVWLEEPMWDCGWYWGFGYIERYTNRNGNPVNARDISSHTHWTSEIVGPIGENKYIHHMNENPLFETTTLKDNESWKLSDLMKSFYTLRQTAELFHSGNSHLTSTSPLSLKNPNLEDHINKNLLPKVFKEIDKILSPAHRDRR